MMQIGDAIKFIGLLVYVAVYIIKPDYLHRIPFKIYAVMVFNQAGACLVSAETRTEGLTYTKGVDTHLLTSFVVAISSFLEESVGAEAPLSMIITDDRCLLTHRTSELNIMVVSETPNHFLWQSVKKFGRILDDSPQPLKDALIKGNLNTESLLPRLKRAFPYLRIVERDV